MPVETEVDGSFFTFPDGWKVEKLDEWREQQRATQSPFHSKGCDLAALKDGTLWLVEVKDYTYPNAGVPDDLAEKVGLKFFHSLAILHAVARWGQEDRREFSLEALACWETRVCLAVELPDGGRRLIGVATPLAGLKDRLRRVMKRLNMHHPVISNSHMMNGVPWEIRRDPGTRSGHADR